jgi:alkanesulfonate monooxygenase SsuD/methylene tetrahydromethanopterin reductase-like flavin-dependent oxidoreductase (luciferase family)
VERSVSRFVYCSASTDSIDEVVQKSREQIRVSRTLTAGVAPVAGRNTPAPYPGEPTNESWRQRMVMGTPDECITQLQRFADAGMTYLQATFDFGGLPEDLVLASLKLFTEEVMPAALEITRRKKDDAERTEESSAYLARDTYYQGV